MEAQLASPPSRIDEAVRGLPAPAVRGLVDSYDGYRQRGVPPALHRGLPSPFMTMIVTLHEPLRIVGHVDPRRPASSYDAILGGLHTSPALIAHDGAQSGVQVRLSPLGARALLGVPAGALAGEDLPAADVLGRLADELRERLAEAPSWAERFAILDRVLAHRAADGREPARPVAEAWRALLRSGGQAPVAAIARQVGWSERQLGKRFRQEIGLTPKAAARVVRFHRARHMLQSRAVAGDGLDIAWVAAACGYFDQSHLIRDFNEFAGAPPSRWVRQEFRNVQAWADRAPLACEP